MILKLKDGNVVIELFDDIAPNHVKRFKTLSSEKKYDGVVFHRVIDGFMAQTGDVQYGNSSSNEYDLRRVGTGGSTLPDLPSEFSDIPKAIANNQSINILIERNNQIIEKNFDLKFNEELNRYIIGISSPQNPIIDKFNFIDSIKNSSLFIPTYYAASFSFLQQSYTI